MIRIQCKFMEKLKLSSPLNFTTRRWISETAIEEDHFPESQPLTTKRFRWRAQKNEEPFKLTDAFLSKYSDKKPPFGFSGLGEVVYLRTYSRTKDNGEKEIWFVVKLFWLY